MDKTSFFFAMQCGACHPGGAALAYDREGQRYWDGSVFGHSRSASPPADPQLDGDYGFVNPATGAKGAAAWNKTGVSEADCLLCHLPGYSWKNRTGTLGAGAALTDASGQPVAAFAAASTAGLGFAQVTFVTPAPPQPKAQTVTIDYAAGGVKPDGTTALTLDNVGTFLERKVRDENCRLCHATPDRKKSGRSWTADTDVHKAAGLGCVDCHPAGPDHQIAKGDIVIGSVRDDLDGGMVDCAGCHLEGRAPAGMSAPDPTVAHGDLPAIHLEKLACQACHIRYLQDAASSADVTEIPEVFLDMVSTGVQTPVLSSATFGGGKKLLGSDPLDPSRDLPELVAAAAEVDPATGKPHTEYLTRWYPSLRPWKGPSMAAQKLVTVKPLLTAWFGDWLSGDGLDARIRPIPLRLVRKALTGTVATPAPGAPPNPYVGGLALADDDGDGKPELNTRAEIKAFLQAIASATDVDGTTPIVTAKAVLVKAPHVWFLDASGEAQSFESPVAESHDFAVNHNVVPKRDPLSPTLKPGPWGSAGCAECHSPQSAFFFGKQLIEVYDETGAPQYEPHWAAMGYTAERAAALTASVPQPPAPPPPTTDTVKKSSGGCGSSGAAAAPAALLGLALPLLRRRRRVTG
ncbi:cytochrome c3 family protein [Anaeromyxobacter soli]|uniref:multiheme c-type cytochrome n=1 Tax=Anaeromyxobacter soli TaxID=2922725 RepID=UPI001FAFC38F|nr:multiheme c-type cytochrome [Anaeromyxobacter sp. SG29]